MRPSVAIDFVATDLEGSKLVFDPEATRYGITQTVYDRFRRLRAVPERTVGDITLDEAILIYSANYWDPIKASQLPDGVDLALFQMGVNIGVGRAVRIFQRILGVDQDGVVGPKTVAAAQAVAADKLTDDLLKAQDDYYDSIYAANPTRNAPYIKGWHNRVTRTRLFLASGLTERGALGLGGLIMLLAAFMLAAVVYKASR